MTMRSLPLLLAMATASPVLAADSAAKVHFLDYRSCLLHWEGYSLTPHRDYNGTIAVGIGHNLTAHKAVRKRRYTSEEVDRLFQRDLTTALRAARAGVKDFDSLPHEARLVTISLIWQVGPTGFMRFKDYRTSISERNWSRAASELRDSLWYRQTPKARRNWAISTLKGLTR